MKKAIIAAFLFCLTSSIASAQIETKKPVLCFPINELLKEIKLVGEEPIWTGPSTDGDSVYALLVNKKDNTWTIIQFSEKMGCVLGMGKKSKLVFKGV